MSTPFRSSTGSRYCAPSTSDRCTTAANLLEAAIVVEARQGLDAARDLDLLVSGAIHEIVPVDEGQIAAGVQAWRRFGKGRHAAGLNVSDCFAYALAKTRDVPLLFTGENFTQTDLPAAR